MARIAAVLLAAGASRRFGEENKLFADIGGEPLVRRVARVLVESGLAEIIAVTGGDSQSCIAALEGLPVRCVHNESWEAGMGGSIAAGVRELGPVTDGAFIVPGDMPFLSSAVLAQLVAEFERSGAGKIVFPVTPEGEQRNPVLWPRRYFPQLAALRGSEGAKRLMQSAGAEAVRVIVEDAIEFSDVDTPADLQAARARLKST